MTIYSMQRSVYPAKTKIGDFGNITNRCNYIFDQPLSEDA